MLDPADVDHRAKATKARALGVAKLQHLLNLPDGRNRRVVVGRRMKNKTKSGSTKCKAQENTLLSVEFLLHQ